MKRILWVDDEIDLLKPHLLFLQARGYHVDAIANGDDALELIRESPYDLVLLDEQMPGRRGLEVLEILRREAPHQRVVMVTKSEEDHTMTEAIGRRVDDYLVKPTSPRQVLSVVTRVLEGSSIRQQRVAQDFAARFPTLSRKCQEAQHRGGLRRRLHRARRLAAPTRRGGRAGAARHRAVSRGGSPPGLRHVGHPRVSALDARSQGPPASVRGHRARVPGPEARIGPGLLRRAGLHASGSVARHDAAPGRLLRDRGDLALLDPADGDALCAQRDLQRTLSGRDRGGSPGVVGLLGRRGQPERLRGHAARRSSSSGSRGATCRSTTRRSSRIDRAIRCARG